MQRMQRQRVERVLSRFAGEMSRENDGKDFNTNRSVFGVLFSLENVEVSIPKLTTEEKEF